MLGDGMLSSVSWRSKDLKYLKWLLILQTSQFNSGHIIILPEHGDCLAETNIMVIEIAETKECDCGEQQDARFSKLDLNITVDIVC